MEELSAKLSMHRRKLLWLRRFVLQGFDLTTPKGMYANRSGKVIHIDAKPSVRKQIVRELHIMHECHSAYIVSFYGAFLNEGDVVMCMEYMDCGLDPPPPPA